MHNILVTSFEAGEHLVMTSDDEQAAALVAQYMDPCDFDGMARETSDEHAHALVACSVDSWSDYGGTVYQLA